MNLIQNPIFKNMRVYELPKYEFCICDAVCYSGMRFTTM